MDMHSAERVRDAEFEVFKEQAHEPSDGFQTVVSILIALITVISAAFAYRAAVAENKASLADSAAINANLKAEQERVSSTANALQDKDAYTSWRRYNTLGDLIASDLAPATKPRDQAAVLGSQMREAWDLALAVDRFFQPRYLNATDESYDVLREEGATFADASRDADLNPAPHLAEAISKRDRSGWLIALMIVMAGSLWFFTLAYGASIRVRSRLAIVGGTLLAGGLFAAIAVGALA
jgi:CHASE1-domain containing sensor protein